MTQAIPRRPALANFSSARQRHLAAVIMLVLFCVSYNIGAVFFQARGVPAGHTGVSLFGYLAGALASAIVFDSLEQRLASLQAHMEDGKDNAAFLRFSIFFALLSPGLFCVASFIFVPYSANLFFNLLQPFLWGITLPVALRLFFLHVDPRRQALFLALP